MSIRKLTEQTINDVFGKLENELNNFTPMNSQQLSVMKNYNTEGEFSEKIISKLEELDNQIHELQLLESYTLEEYLNIEHDSIL